MISSGEVWEEVDLNNWPTDWVVGDLVRVDFQIGFSSNSPYSTGFDLNSRIITFSLISLKTPCQADTPLLIKKDSSTTASALNYIYIKYIRGNNFNSAGDELFRIEARYNSKVSENTINKSNLTTYVRKMWRKRVQT